MKLLSIALITALGVAACQASEPPAEATPSTPASSAPDAAAAPVTPPPVPAEVDPLPSGTPVIDLPALDGTRYVLAERRGQWVVVNFWATWCKPCLKEMPDLDQFDRARADVEVVGLAYEEITPEDMKAFLAKRPVAYPIVILDPYAPPTDFPTPRGLPMTYLVNPEGRAVDRFLGPVTSQDLAAAIDRAKAATP